MFRGHGGLALSRRGCIITMADRYQDQPFPVQESYDRRDRGGDPYGAGRGEGDPLAELARLIGQTDSLGGAAKPPPHPLQPRSMAHPHAHPAYDLPEANDFDDSPSPPQWMQRARQEATPPPLDDDEQDYQPAPVHPLHRYAGQHPQALEQDYEPQYADAEPRPDLSRYDDALYGRIDSGGQDDQRDPSYPDDPYAYQQNDYQEEAEPRKRSTGMMTIAAVLALAVVGTGGAFAYRTYVGSPRSGEPPIIKADNSPTKVVPAQSDAGTSKTPDRLLPGDGSEKLVSREETPVDVNSRSGAPRVVFPAPNQNGNSLPVGSVSPAGPPSNSEPRKIKTLAVKGDVAENGGIPTGTTATPAKPAPASRSIAAPAAAPPAPAVAPPAAAGRNPASANASANAPISLTPQGGQPSSDPAPTRMAATNPVQTAASAGGGYLVQVSSQKTEADAQASYRTLQGKFQTALGSRPPLIKRADLGEKGVVYRAMVGPFGSSDEAKQFCMSLQSAGGQCFVPRN
jgi:SPOR domain